MPNKSPRWFKPKYFDRRGNRDWSFFGETCDDQGRPTKVWRHQPAPGYDHLPERCFEFIPLWGLRVFLLYRMRRVTYPAPLE
jgi:hypothetical protein